MAQNHRILVIDDEPGILNFLEYYLGKDGTTVDTAQGPHEGLALLSKHRYDLVVCDYLMPELDGLALLKEVRAQQNFVTFIFFSGNVTRSYEVKMTGHGAYCLVLKTDLEVLKRVVEKTLKTIDSIGPVEKSNSDMDLEFLELVSGSKLAG